MFWEVSRLIFRVVDSPRHVGFQASPPLVKNGSIFKEY